jgi:hypothetical protein
VIAGNPEKFSVHLTCSLINTNPEVLGERAMSMKRLIVVSLVLALLLMLVPATVFAHTEADPLIVELIAGGGNEASATADNLR